MVSKDRGQAPEEEAPGIAFGSEQLYLVQNSEGLYVAEPESLEVAKACGVDGPFEASRLEVMEARAAAFGYILSYPGGLV